MNYELAKQLKDAGFLFKICSPNEYGVCENRHCKQLLNDCHFCDPSLSELIGACGKELVLENGEKFIFQLKAHTDYWEAEFTDFQYQEWSHIHGTGVTPEEAVAKLWLELNKK